MVWAGAAIDSDTVYLCSEDLYALNLDRGNLLWKTEPLRAFGATTAAVGNDSILVCGTDRLYSIEVQSGSVRFSLAPGSRDSSPCVEGGIVYWGGVDGQLHAADIKTGSRLWSFDTGNGEALRFTPSIGDGTVFVAGNTAVFALDSVSGALKWRCKYADEACSTHGSAPIHNGILLLAVNRVGVLGIDTRHGDIAWQTEISSGPFTAACVDESNGVAYVAGNRLEAFRMEDGNNIWAGEGLGFATSAPILIGSHIYIGGGYDRYIYAFDRHTGEKVWEYPTGDLVYSTPAYANGRLVIGCHDGYLYCFEQA